MRRTPPDVSREHGRRIEAARPLSRAAVCVGAVTLGAGLAMLLLDGWELGPALLVGAGTVTLLALSLAIRRSRLCPACGKLLGPESGLFCPVCGSRISRVDLDRGEGGAAGGEP
jgi:hypothetical protein